MVLKSWEGVSERLKNSLYWASRQALMCLIFKLLLKDFFLKNLTARVSISAQSAPRTRSCLPWAMIGLVLCWVLQSCNPCKLSRVAVLQNHKVTTATRPKSQFMRDGWHLFIAKSHVYKCYCRTSTPWLCHKSKSFSNTRVPLALCWSTSILIYINSCHTG